MSGTELRAARERADLTQDATAHRLGVTQAYLSMVECGRRPLSSRLALKAVKTLGLSPTELPVRTTTSASQDDDQLKSELGALGYPGFAYLRGRVRRNPVELLFCALNRADLDARVKEALPWVAYTFGSMDWEWLVGQAKLHDLQNRLGFVVTLAMELSRNRDAGQREKLNGVRQALEKSKLVREDTLCSESMTNAEKNWLRRHRPEAARAWNLLTDLSVKHLPYAA